MIQYDIIAQAERLVNYWFKIFKRFFAPPFLFLFQPPAPGVFPFSSLPPVFLSAAKPGLRSLDTPLPLRYRGRAAPLPCAALFFPALHDALEKNLWPPFKSAFLTAPHPFTPPCSGAAVLNHGRSLSGRFHVCAFHTAGRHIFASGRASAFPPLRCGVLKQDKSVFPAIGALSARRSRT